MALTASTNDTRDRFGNPIAVGLAYARGAILSTTETDLQKLNQAWKHIRARVDVGGLDAVFNFSGLDRCLDIRGENAPLLDDEIAPALLGDELTRLGLEHLGGDAARHDVLLVNRTTAGLLLSADVLVDSGGTVVGVSPRYSHPAVVRAAAHGGAHLVDTAGLSGFHAALETLDRVDAVFLTRLAVSYEILSADELREIVATARRLGAKIILDDAGGARVGPAVFEQPRSLELDVDVAVTGLDKYGTRGPRLGLLGGEKKLVERIRARAFEMGLEARPMLYPAVVDSLKHYRPERIRELVATTKDVATELKSRLGASAVTETPVICQLTGEDILELVMQRAGVNQPAIVPYEATAALAMLLLRDFGIMSVHFAGIPPGTSALMIKFVRPEVLARFGGAAKLAEAIDTSLHALAKIVANPDAIRRLVLGASHKSDYTKPLTRFP